MATYSPARATAAPTATSCAVLQKSISMRSTDTISSATYASQAASEPPDLSNYASKIRLQHVTPASAFASSESSTGSVGMPASLKRSSVCVNLAG